MTTIGQLPLAASVSDSAQVAIFQNLSLIHISEPTRPY